MKKNNLHFHKRRRRRIVAKLFILLVILGIAGIAVFYGMLQRRFPASHMEYVKTHAGVFEPAFILAVIHAESSFRPTVVSHAGARGLMQIMPTTGEWLAGLMGLADFDTEQLFDPETNIKLGTFYLNWLYRQFGDTTLVLAAYNAGQGNVRQWLANAAYSEDGTTLSHIPFPETREYVRRVARNRRIYEFLLRLPGWG